MGLYNNRIVVKVGTSTLTNDSGKSDLRATDRLVCTLADIHNMGYEVILVSSGAIAVGRNKLNMHARPDSMRMKQAAAAVGQCSLMYLYDKFFGDYDKTVAQILLNAEDIEQEEKKENLTNTFNALLEMGVIPIVNENDSVSYTEIESEDRLFGDNDMLSSVVAVLCRAKKLVILSDIDGFYDSDPRLHPNAKLIEQIDEIDESVYSLAGGAGSRRPRHRRDAHETPGSAARHVQRDRHHRHQRQAPGSSLRYRKGRESRDTVHRKDIRPA